MTGQAVMNPNTRYDDIDRNVRRFSRIAITGLTTSNITALTCSASDVALIDKIVIRAQNLDTGFQLNGALSGAAVTSVVVDTAIPTWVPATGTISITRANGTVTEIAYTSWAVSTFTIGATDFSTNNALDNAVVFLNGGNLDVTLEVNDVVLPFHITSGVNTRRNKPLVLRPRGNMVVQNSMTLKAKASLAGVATISVYYRMMPQTMAYQLRLINGALPQVASTNTLTGSGLSAATAKKIVNVGEGQAIEILGFYLTGHNYSASADSIALGFWEASGTFYTPPATKAANARMVCVSHHQGASADFAPEIIVDNTDGCIQGPVGFDLYVQASTRIAGATPNADYVVMYRIVPLNKMKETMTLSATYTSATTTSIVLNQAIRGDLPQVGTLYVLRPDTTLTQIVYTAWTGSTFTIDSTDFSSNSPVSGANVYIYEQPDVNDSNGGTGQSLLKLKKWWVSSIAAFVPFSTNTVTAIFDSVPTPGAGTNTIPGNPRDCLVKVKGYVGTFLAGRPGTSDTFVGLTGLMEGYVVGAALTAATAYPLLGHMALSDANPNGTDADTSRWVCEAEELVPTLLSKQPCLNALEITASDHTARFQLGWGTFGSYKDTAGLATLMA